MAAAVTRISLVELERPGAAQWNAAILEQNLAALAGSQPDLAVELRRIAPVFEWSAALALDQSVTLVRTDASGAVHWLGGSAAPRARAEGLLGHQAPTGHNFLLPDLAAGCETELLLHRLPAQCAIYAVVQDAAHLSAVMRIRDFVQGIAGGRVYFLPAQREERCLQELAESYPGLLPPGTVVDLPWVAPDRRDALVAACRHTYSEVTGRRSAELQESASAATEPSKSESRVLVVSRTLDRASHAIAQALAKAASAEGDEVALHCFDTPRHAHPLELARRARSHFPSLVVWLDSPDPSVRLAEGVRQVEWRLSPSPSSTGPSASTVVCSAYDPPPDSVEKRLAPAAIPAHAADETGNRQLVVFTDDPDPSAAAAGVDQPTHRQLWDEAYRLAQEQWAQATPAAGDLLSTATRNTRLPCDSHTFESFLPKIRARLIPAALRSALAVWAARNGWTLRTLNRNQLTDIPAAPDSAECAALLIGPLPYAGFFVLTACARGWPVFIGRHDGSLETSVKGLLLPNENYLRLHCVRDLSAWLRQPPPKRVAQVRRTMQHVLQRHTLAQRWRELRSHVPPMGRPETA